MKFVSRKLYNIFFLHRSSFIIFIFLLILGQLQRIQVTSSTAIYLHDVWITTWCILALILDSLFRKRLKNFLQLRKKIWEVVFVTWIAVGLGVALALGTSILPAVLYMTRLSVYLVFGGLLWHLRQSKILSKTAVTVGFLVYATFLLYFGFLQYVFLPDTRWLYFLGWDDHYYRLISTLLEPGFTGIIFVLSFCLIQAVDWKQLKYFTQTQFSYFKIFALLLLEVGILLTYSRASFLAFVVVQVMTVFYFLKSKFIRKALLPLFYLLFFIVAVPLLPRPGGEGVALERTSTVNARTSNIQQALRAMQTRDWIFGKGLFLTAEPVKENQNFLNLPDHSRIPDNWLVFLLTGSGVVGLVLFSILLWKYFYFFYQRNIWLAFALVAILVHSFFDASIVYPFAVLFFLGLVVGLL